MRRIERLLLLRPGELARALPFFALYAALFAAFTLADGLSLALFLEANGRAALPGAIVLVACSNLAFIGGYVALAEQAPSSRVFQAVLLGGVGVFGAAWAACRWLDGGPGWFGALFVTREVAFTLLLMHFGTYLQDYFTRDQLDRVLPVVYAGGRVGGIAGGWLLERLSDWPGPLDAVPVFLGLSLACVVAVEAVSRAASRLPPRQGPPPRPGGAEEEAARHSLAGFLRFTWSSPLLFWLTVSSVLFMLSRWLINYQYSAYFEGHFDGPGQMAAFLGRYTQLALLVSLAVQLFVVSRMVRWLGVGGAYLLYGALVFGGSLLGVGEMSLAAAVSLRLLETELRLGLRNPLSQLLTNRFPRPLRLRVRAWTMGLLTPAGTALASAVLWLVGGDWAGWATAGAALAFFASAAGVWWSLGPSERGAVTSATPAARTAGPGPTPVPAGPPGR